MASGSELETAELVEYSTGSYQTRAGRTPDTFERTAAASGGGVARRTCVATSELAGRYAAGELSSG